MNKGEFLKNLDLQLQRMSKEERNKFINYYDEILSDYIEDGMSEEAAVEKIGTPDQVAGELIENHGSIKINLPGAGNKVLNYTLLILGFPLWGSLVLAIALCILSVYIILWCLPVITGAGAISFLATSIVGILGAPFVMANSLTIGFIQLGTGIAAIGLAFLLAMATVYLSKVFVVKTAYFNQRIKTIFRKKVVIG